MNGHGNAIFLPDVIHTFKHLFLLGFTSSSAGGGRSPSRLRGLLPAGDKGEGTGGGAACAAARLLGGNTGLLKTRFEI